MSYQRPQWDRPLSATTVHDEFDGATLRRAKEALEQAQNMLAMAHKEKAEMMEALNYALWCDIKDHAFSAKDKGKRSITMTQWDDDRQEDVQVIVMSCGPCAAVNPLIQAAQPDRPVRVEAAKSAPGTRYDAEYTKRLEREVEGRI